MVPPRYRAFAWTAPVLVLDSLLITFLDADPPTAWWQWIFIGLVFGSMFGQTTLAAAWTAFGPTPLAWRLPGSLVWVFMVVVGLAINTAINGGPIDGSLFIGAILFCQWLFLQLVFSAIKLGFGVELRYVEDARRRYDPSARQFGIRQLMIITAIVGVAFGIGRLIIPRLIEAMHLAAGDMPIFAFFVVAEVVLTVPLVIAALLRRFATGGVLVALALVALVTFGEAPLLQMFSVGPGGPKTLDFVALNAAVSVLIVGVLTIVRRCGYNLVAAQRADAQ